jgi:hypothetical protein
LLEWDKKHSKYADGTPYLWAETPEDFEHKMDEARYRGHFPCGKLLLKNTKHEAKNASPDSAAAVHAGQPGAPAADRPGGPPPEPQPAPFTAVNMATTRPRRLEWLWPGWAPRKSLGIIMGDPKLAKSQFLLDVAARISRGDAMPDGSKGALYDIPSVVLIVSTEDLRDEVIRPRLEALRANMANVEIINVEPSPDDPDGLSELPQFPGDLGRFEETLKKYKPAFVILDAGDATINPKEVNLSGVGDPRMVYDPLFQIAVRQNTTIIMVRHENKDKRGGPQARNQGAMSITGTIRFAWEVIPLKGHFIDNTADPPRKLEQARVYPWASNWGKLPDQGLCYAKDAVYRDIQYEGEDKPERVEVAKIQYIDCLKGKKAAATNGQLSARDKAIVEALEAAGKYQAKKTLLPAVCKIQKMSASSLDRGLENLMKLKLVETNGKKPAGYRLIAPKERGI